MSNLLECIVECAVQHSGILRALNWMFSNTQSLSILISFYHASFYSFHSECIFELELKLQLIKMQHFLSLFAMCHLVFDCIDGLC